MLKVACLPSHPLEKLVARKKRRGSEAVYEAKVQSGLNYIEPLLPIRVGLTQKYSKKEWNHWRVVCSSHLGKDD